MHLYSSKVNLANYVANPHCAGIQKHANLLNVWRQFSDNFLCVFRQDPAFALGKDKAQASAPASIELSASSREVVPQILIQVRMQLFF